MNEIIEVGITVVAYISMMYSLWKIFQGLMEMETADRLIRKRSQ